MKKHASSILLAVGLLLAATSAFAQSTTTGAVKGVITDDATGEVVSGATVVATSPVLQGTQAQLTDDSGVYYIANLPPGTYSITVFYGEGKWERGNVIVKLGKVARINVRINSEAAGGETIIVEGTAPVIDQGSTKTGVVIGDDYTRRIPTGRTFQGTLGAAAGSQGDDYGVSFGGSTSAENTYIIEGVNVTDPAYGGATTDFAGAASTTTNLPNEFVRETEVITGGYNAEFGRSTGAVVNVVTKSGGNEFHGSVFSYFTPGALSPTPRELPREGSAIVAQSELNYLASIGGELGGPIVKDKVWFHVGFNPVFVSSDINRIVKSFQDADQDGIPDVDENEFTIANEVDRTALSRGETELVFHGKLSFAATPDHQGAVSVFGNPGYRDGFTTVSGPPKSGQYDLKDGAVDVSGKWTSKFADNASQIDAVVGYHRNRTIELPTDAGHDPQVRFEYDLPLSSFGAYEDFYGGVPEECVDGGAADDYPMIDNCPVRFYNTGGIGFRETNKVDRLSGALKFTQRVKAVGHHRFKVGADVEQMGYDHLSDFTGGTRYRYSAGSIRADRFFTVSDDGTTPCGDDLDGDGVGDAGCEFQVHGLRSDTSTRSIGAFAQDSWSILPNLTVNAGLRWERQDAFVADHIVGETSPTTGEPIPDKAFALSNMLAPRVGVIYDWTEEGRSKVFGHWGRFYEMVPMDINARAYGGEVFAVDILIPGLDLDGDGATACSDVDVATNNPTMVSCDYDDSVFAGLFGGGEEVVVPDLKGQYLDEFVGGVEYELFEDFKAGATYIHRELGRVIEDVSVDGANSYIVANPGEAVSESDIQDLRDQAAAAAAAGNDAKAAYLENQADSFAGVNRFDTPERRYDGLQLHAEKRFSRDLMLIASYTYSKLKGNFPGLFSPDTGQLDPNLTSMYDLPELMANRYGDLPHDKPHLVKLDGYYLYDAGKATGWFIFGASARAASGRPVNTLGAHNLYGFNESYILPRGMAGPGMDDRTPFTFGFDTRVTYGRQLSKGMKLEAFVDVFNLFNSETTLEVDEAYTFDDVNPIVGGDKDDVEHLKALDPSTGVTTALTAEQNPNYGNPTRDIAVRSFRFGLRLTF